MTIHCASFNINNINCRLLNLLQWLRETEPDVVCLQELKATDAERRTRGRPGLLERGTVLGAVKAWPLNAGARTEATATASLDGACARCPAQRAGRGEGTASWHEQRNCTDQERAMT